MAFLSILFLGHLVGDFYLQTNWMALNKSKWNQSAEGLKALSSHAGYYTLTMFLALLAGSLVTSNRDILGERGVVFLLATFILHFLTDAVTSKMTTKWWFIPMRPIPVKLEEEFGTMGWSHFCRFDMTARQKFFRWLGDDQTIHVLCLIWTAHFCFGI